MTPDYYDLFNDPWLHGSYERYKGVNDRLLVIIIHGLTVLLFVVVAMAFITLFSGCATPRAVEQHHHHYYEADTLAVQAQVDKAVKTWSERIDSAWWERFSQFTSQQQSSEQQHETIQETVTVTLDSLGREIRQEQRTISRDISREQQILKQRLTREFEGRLQMVTDSLNGSWQERFNILQSHFTKNDSTSSTETPVAVNEDNRPWYRKLWGNLQYILIGAVLALGVWFTRKWWLKLFGI